MQVCWGEDEKIWLETQTTEQAKQLKYPYGSLEFLLARRITMRSRQTLIDFTAIMIHESTKESRQHQQKVSRKWKHGE